MGALYPLQIFFCSVQISLLQRALKQRMETAILTELIHLN